MKLIVIATIGLAMSCLTSAERDRRSIIGYFFGDGHAVPYPGQQNTPSPLSPLEPSNNVTSFIDDALRLLNSTMTENSTFGHDMLDMLFNGTSIGFENVTSLGSKVDSNSTKIRRHLPPYVPALPSLIDILASANMSGNGSLASHLFNGTNFLSAIESNSTEQFNSTTPSPIANATTLFPAIRTRRQAPPAEARPAVPITIETNGTRPVTVAAKPAATKGGRPIVNIPTTVTVANDSSASSAMAASNAAQQVVVNILIGRDGADNSTQLFVNGTELTTNGTRPVKVHPALIKGQHVRPVYRPHAPHHGQVAPHGQLVPPYAAPQPINRNYRKPADC